MLPTTRSPAGDTPPRSLYVAGCGWLLLALGCACYGLFVQQIREGYPLVVGGDVVAGQISRAPATLWLAGGIAVAILAALLVYLSQGWTIYPLVTLGVAIVITLSVSGTPVALVAMAGLLIGTMPLGLEAAYRYLTEGSPT